MMIDYLHHHQGCIISRLHHLTRKIMAKQTLIFQQQHVPKKSDTTTPAIFNVQIVPTRSERVEGTFFGRATSCHLGRCTSTSRCLSNKHIHSCPSKMMWNSEYHYDGYYDVVNDVVIISLDVTCQHHTTVRLAVSLFFGSDNESFPWRNNVQVSVLRHHPPLTTSTTLRTVYSSAQISPQ